MTSGNIITLIVVVGFGYMMLKGGGCCGSHGSHGGHGKHDDKEDEPEVKTKLPSGDKQDDNS